MSRTRDRPNVPLKAIAGEGRSSRAPHGVRGREVATIVVVMIALGIVPSLAWKVVDGERAPGGRQSAPDPRYPSQSGSLHRARKSAVATRAAQEVQPAKDICGGVGLQQLASKYGVPPDPNRVARRFARGYEPGLQPIIRRGCLQALRTGG